jgi:type II secretory pathway pseudopilin PulG
MTMTATTKKAYRLRASERGMSLIAVMGLMTLITVALLAVAPSVQIDVQREKELETIRRGEEIADAIRQYVEYYRGAKLPSSMDDLLEGLPQGTKKRQILRASAAIDPMSEDGKWRLIKNDDRAFINFAKRVQDFNNGLLPSNPSQIFDRYAITIVNSIDPGSESDKEEADDTEISMLTENTPFIGVASQSRAKSVIAYYGIENHSKWIFTPLFRGSGSGQNTRGGSGFGNGSTKQPIRTTISDPDER